MSKQAMQRAATRIVNSDDMIRGVNQCTWRVASRSTRGKWHKVVMNEGGLECTCDYCQKRGAACVHSTAVEMLILQRAFKMKPGNKKVVVEEEVAVRCPKGHTENLSRAGKRERVYREPAQRYRCPKCRKRFTWDEVGFAGMHYPPAAVLLAISLFVIGNAPADIALVIRQNMSITVHETTVQRWAKRYIALVELYARNLPVRTGGAWSVDEKYLLILGEGYWLFTMMDQYTRFLLAWHVSAKKDGYNAKKLFGLAAARACCVPAILKSDSLPSFRSACEQVFCARSGSEVLHWCDCHMRGIFKENNGHERANSTFGGLIRTDRGLQTADSIIIRAALLHYNFGRPHSGIGRRTPAAAANIIIRGDNPWRTLIQNALLPPGG